MMYQQVDFINIELLSCLSVRLLSMTDGARINSLQRHTVLLVLKKRKFA